MRNRRTHALRLTGGAAKAGWREVAPGSALTPAPPAIVGGLFVGNQFGAFWALVRADVIDMPACATWRQAHGMTLSCGIGLESALSGIGGFLLLGFAKGDEAC